MPRFWIRFEQLLAVDIKRTSWRLNAGSIVWRLFFCQDYNIGDGVMELTAVILSKEELWFFVNLISKCWKNIAEKSFPQPFNKPPDLMELAPFCRRKELLYFHKRSCRKRDINSYTLFTVPAVVSSCMNGKPEHQNKTLEKKERKKKNNKKRKHLEKRWKCSCFCLT